MKQLLFSLIIVGVLGFTVANATVTTPPDKTSEQQQADILDYIKNPPAGTVPTKYSRAEVEAFLTETKANKSIYLNAEDELFMTLKPGQSADDFIKAIQIENARRIAAGTGQGLLPDPTTSTTQNSPNNGTINPPLDGPRPDINGTVLPVTPNGSQVQTPTNIPFLDKFVPITAFQNRIQDGALNKILNQLFYLGLIVAVVLAVVMIVRGGVEYMTVDAVASKDSGKKRVQAALGGLLLAFSAILILNTVNPALTKLNIVFPDLKKIAELNLIGSLTNGTRNPDGTITTASGQTITTTADGIIVVNPDGTTFKAGAVDAVTGEFTAGKATNFGYNDSMDNGQGSPHLDPNNGQGIVTNRSDLFGVALPQSVLMKELGLPPITNTNWSEWAAARNAGVLVTDGSKSYIVPIVDLGPGSGPQSKGVVIDETKALNNAFGGDGNRSYKIIPNYYSR